MENSSEVASIIADFDAAEGFEKIVTLTTHPNQAISKKANEFIKKYYYVEDVPPEYEQQQQAQENK